MKFNPQNVSLKLSAGRKEQFPNDRKPRIALSGRSNVGKSSCINTVLCRKKLARTSSEPGKTITVNFYDIDGKFYLVDLPGYGYARRSESDAAVWRALTDSFLCGEEKPSLIIQMIDLKVGPTGDDCMMLDWLNANKCRYIIVATKSDKLSKTEKERNLSALRTHPLLNPPEACENIRVISFSSLTGEGKDEVLDGIIKALG